jgi:hypothetical protein
MEGEGLAAPPEAEDEEDEEEKSAMRELRSASMDGSSEGSPEEAAAPGREEAPAEMARTA